MTFSTLVRVLLRRWYLTLPLFAAVAYVAVEIPPQLPVDYRTTAAVVLVGPEITEAPPSAAAGARNRLLHLGDSLEAMSKAVGLTLQTDSVRHRFARDGLADDYVISIGEDTPIIEFTVRGAQPEVVQKTAEALLGTVEDAVENAQNELVVPAEERLVVRRISSGNVPYPGVQSDKRSLALLLAAGGIVAAALVATADVALRRLATVRAARRHPRPHDAAAASAVPSLPTPERPIDKRDPQQPMPVVSVPSRPAPLTTTARISAPPPTRADGRGSDGTAPATAAAPEPSGARTKRPRSDGPAAIWSGVTLAVVFHGREAAREAARWVGGAAQAGGATVTVRALDSMDLDELAHADLVFIGAQATTPHLSGEHVVGAQQLERSFPPLWGRRVATYTTHRRIRTVEYRAALALADLVAAKGADVVASASFDQRDLPDGIPAFVDHVMSIVTAPVAPSTGS